MRSGCEDWPPGAKLIDRDLVILVLKDQDHQLDDSGSPLPGQVVVLAPRGQPSEGELVVLVPGDQNAAPALAPEAYLL